MDNTCVIQLQGVRYPGFRITRGIRQGCPLSPLLFAVATDLLLRRARRCIATMCSRAWADDLAMVLREGLRSLSRLQSFFLDFEAVSGLALNIEKTVLVPPFRREHDALRVFVAAMAPCWAGIHIASAAKYLGFFVGRAKRSRGTPPWRNTWAGRSYGGSWDWA